MDAHGNTVVDIFADRATPVARLSRPALFRARAAWAAQAIAAKVAPLFDRGQGVRTIGGVSVGDTVDVETHPSRRRRGVVVAWEAPSPETTPIAGAFPVARIRLDPLPGFPPGTPNITHAPRWRIHPVKD